ncbi:hypothetical protein C8J55DRAFT_60294 [Lentinula edodes]|uniref:Secreted protein n=1 Tax=Lentinula lateritia TaxID=40482 RepID=A0A9W9AH80_9AGAR|nr:hypothetical protein C8J55DRAFT_60294 [Lentinula edodes]
MRTILLALALDIVVLELVSTVPMQESLSFPCAVCPLLIAGGILTSAVEKEGNSLECRTRMVHFLLRVLVRIVREQQPFFHNLDSLVLL